MNQSGTRTRLLTAASKLFGSKGFRAASVREITASAQANLGAVTYHFGTKANLYAAVLDQSFDRLATHIEEAAGAGRTSPESVRGIVATVFGFFREAPDVPRMILHQVSSRTPPPESVLRHLYRIVAAVQRVVSAGRTRGEFRNIEPVLVTFSLISQSVWFALAGAQIGPVLYPGLSSSALAGKIESHVADVIGRALAADEDTP
jgi:AcrR family transcriptional regulator